MKNAAHWEVEDNVIAFLTKQLKGSTISLVLGSGISTKFGLPDWDTLITRLANGKSLPDDFYDLTAKQQASYIKTKLFSNNEKALNSKIRDVIYENAKLDFETLQSSKLLVSLAALIMASSRGSVSNVVTFNYDDILETYLSFFGFTCESAIDGITWASNKDVVVYHPHGFMPHDMKKPIEGDVVLDSSSFHTIMQENNHWRRKLFNIFSSTFPIFIGVSGNDEHLLAHLEECKKSHVSIVKDKTPYWGVWFTTDIDSAKAQLWKDLKVYPYKVNSWDDVPHILFKICQEASKSK